jgi:UDP-N-acetylmuramoyl-L-alanyl-D-glutamate--2,6-diaminopimelate ligase
MNLNKILKNCQGITDDSRKVKKGFAFFAIKGSAFDGNDYIESAHQNDAEIIFGEIDKPKFLPDDFNYYKIDNSRQILAEAAKIFYKDISKDLKLVGVTGTNGKTTISSLVYNILKKSGRKVALIGTNGIWINNEKIDASLTTPGIIDLYELLVKIKNSECEYCVMEVSSHALHQKRVFGIDYNVAIFSNLSQDHLDYHGTMDEYAKAKKILFDELSKDSFAISNLDDELGEFMLKDAEAQVIGVSSQTNADVTFKAEANQLVINGTSYQNNLVGNFNNYNLTQAILAVQIF